MQNIINRNQGKAAILDYACHGDLRPNDVADPGLFESRFDSHIPRHAMAIPPRKMINLINSKKTRPPGFEDPKEHGSTMHR